VGSPPAGKPVADRAGALRAARLAGRRVGHPGALAAPPRPLLLHAGRPRLRTPPRLRPPLPARRSRRALAGRLTAPRLRAGHRGGECLDGGGGVEGEARLNVGVRGLRPSPPRPSPPLGRGGRTTLEIAGLQELRNSREDRLKVLEDLLIREAQDDVAQRCQIGGAVFVMSLLARGFVNAAVQL